MKNKNIMAAGIAALALSSGFAQAASVSYETSVATQLTNFKKDVGIQKFDSALGTLTSVDFFMSGDVVGSMSYENMSVSSALTTGTLSATVFLSAPTVTTTPLVAVVPLANKADNLSAFDGLMNFGGTSGRTYTDLHGHAEGSSSFTNSSILSLFTGQGFLQAILGASATSVSSGSGNMISYFSTMAGGLARVTYNYTPAAGIGSTSGSTPVPAAIWLFGSAMVGLVGAGKRKKSAATLSA